MKSLTIKHLLFTGLGTITALFASVIELILLLSYQMYIFLFVPLSSKDLALLVTLVTVAVFAPAVEEMSKILPVIIYFEDKGEVERMNFVTLSLASALGFSILENIFYAFGTTDIGIELMILRLAISTPMHLIATFLTAYFYHRYVFCKRGNPALILLGMLVHGLFNGGVVLVGVGR